MKEGLPVPRVNEMFESEMKREEVSDEDRIKEWVEENVFSVNGLNAHRVSVKLPLVNRNKENPISPPLSEKEQSIKFSSPHNARKRDVISFPSVIPNENSISSNVKLPLFVIPAVPPPPNEAPKEIMACDSSGDFIV
jgi:hypothetical protein